MSSAPPPSPSPPGPSSSGTSTGDHGTSPSMAGGPAPAAPATDGRAGSNPPDNGSAMAASDAAALRLNPEVTANSLGEYIQGWTQRVRSGESGMLPVLGGLVLIVIIFQLEKSVFLSAANLTNLLVQGSTFVLLGMAEVFVLLLGEIDLSIGYAGGVGAVVTLAASQPPANHPWWVAVLAGLATTTVMGVLQGLLVTKLRIPSFVVTLAGLLGFEGLLTFLAQREAGANAGGTLTIHDHILWDICNGSMSVNAGWTVLVVGLVGFVAFTLIRDYQRKAHGVVVAPTALTYLKVVLVCAAGVVLVAVCNHNRGVIPHHPVQGVPWVVLVILATYATWSFLLARTRFGRYVYAIGGNAEAARRAGISLTRIRVAAFALTGLTAGIAGIVYASRLGSISNDVDGGQLVLYAVAAAVIGGTSLFGGRGKMLHAVVGGLVIATIYNGMGLLNISSASQYMVTALVLLAAATVDAVARRSASRA